jgi:hypothetical protein
MNTKTDPVETGKEKAQSTADAAKDRAASVRTEAEGAARDAVRSARTRVEAEGNAARDAVADSVDSVAETMGEAAENMTDGSPQAQAAERISDTIAGAAQSLRESDLATLGDSLTRAARRHPVAFAGVAALAGFAAGRFLKATTPDTPGMGAPRASYSDTSYGAPRPSSGATDYTDRDHGRAHGASAGSTGADSPYTKPVQSPPPAAQPVRPVPTSTQAASGSRSASDMADTPGTSKRGTS